MIRTLAAALATTTCIVALATPAAAQTREYNIPAGSLKAALDAYVRQSGRQVVYRADEVRSARSPGVRGSLSSEAALTALLAGSGFTTRVDGNLIAIVKAGNGAATSSPASSGDASPTAREAGLSSEDDNPLAAERVNEEIVVIGTNIRGAAPVGARLEVIDREDIQNGGFTTVQDALAAQPQIYSGGVSELAPVDSTNRNSSWASAPNLRGLGAAATLTLVNGRRLSPSGFAGNYTDISFLPSNLVERIEILPDGASALYGSDAVAGVVNVVLRKDFRGAESGGRLSSVTEGDRLEYQLDQSFGTAWETGSMLIAGEYSMAQPLDALDRNRLSGNHLARGGTDWRASLTTERRCNPGNIQIGGQLYAIPAGQDGTNLEPSDFTAGTQNLCDRNRAGTARPQQERWSLVGMVRQSIAPDTDIFADVIYGRRYAEGQLINALQLTVPASNAFYVHPTGGSEPVRVQYDATEDLGTNHTKLRISTLLATIGANIGLVDDWDARPYLSYASSREVGRAYNGVDPVLLAEALTDPNPATALNVFGDGSHTNPATLARLSRSTYSNTRANSDQVVLNAVADGSLFSLPGGRVRAALGAEFRKLWFENGNLRFNRSDVGLPPEFPFQGHSEKAGAVFGELLVPLFGRPNHRKFLEELSFSLALRHDEYETFGGATVPRIGVHWIPIRGVTLRASWSKSFRAPTLEDLIGLSVASRRVLQDSAAPTGISEALILLGANPDLGPERSTNWSVGLDFAPAALPRFRAGITYFRINYKGKIQAFPTVNVNDPIAAPLITRSPAQGLIDQICATTSFQGNVEDCSARPTDLIFDRRLLNMGQVEQSGIDAQISYSFDISDWLANVSAAATHLLEIDTQLIRPGPVADLLDTIGNPTAWKVRAGASMTRDGFSANLFANYHDAYRASTLPTAARIRSNVTFDLGLSYQTGSGTGIINNTTVSFNVRNLTDRAPPFYDSPFGYDPNQDDITGRTVSIAVRKRW